MQTDPRELGRRGARWAVVSVGVAAWIIGVPVVGGVRAVWRGSRLLTDSLRTRHAGTQTSDSQEAASAEGVDLLAERRKAREADSDLPVDELGRRRSAN